MKAQSVSAHARPETEEILCCSVLFFVIKYPLDPSCMSSSPLDVLEKNKQVHRSLSLELTLHLSITHPFNKMY